MFISGRQVEKKVYPEKISPPANDARVRFDLDEVSVMYCQ